MNRVAIVSTTLGTDEQRTVRSVFDTVAEALAFIEAFGSNLRATGQHARFNLRSVPERLPRARA